MPSPVPVAAVPPVAPSSRPLRRLPGGTFALIVLGTLLGVGQQGRATAAKTCDLTTRELSGCNLNHANLSGADLRDANLSNASFQFSDLNGAKLKDADLSGAFLTRAVLQQTNLSGANLSEANLQLADRSGALFSNTTCPDDTNSDTNGGMCEGHLTR